VKKTRFNGRLVMVGFGSIGQGCFSLLLKHLSIEPRDIIVLSAHSAGRDLAESCGATFRLCSLTPENYREVLDPLLKRGDFLLNLSVDVSSVALVKLANEKGALYLDTCIEPWAGAYTDKTLTISERSNYALRESALALRRSLGPGPTAVMAHGANPGMISHFVKQALLNLASDLNQSTHKPSTRAEWGALASLLGIKVIHIAERDTQVAAHPKKPKEFVNTWSIEGFLSEGFQPAELGFGSHEKALPLDGHRHESGCDAAIYLDRPGASTRVRTWTPLAGPIIGFLITHNEAISIADYLSLHQDGKLTYRPTVHYAYHPCNDAVLSIHELAGRNWRAQDEHRLLMDEIVSGSDELGVLLMGHKKQAYWLGSRLFIEQARALAPNNNATSLQVSASVLAGMVWAINNPDRGVVEAEDMDHDEVIAVAQPYLGEVVGVYGDFSPVNDRGQLFPEAIDEECPWQFNNFRVF
jgi:homospermidine synthase